MTLNIPRTSIHSKIVSLFTACILIAQQSAIITLPLTAHAESTDGSSTVTCVANDPIVSYSGDGSMAGASIITPNDLWAHLPGSSWIWGAPITDGSIDTTEDFSTSLNVTGTVTSATLEFAADNTAVVMLNGTQIASTLSFADITTVNIATTTFNSGVNTLSFSVTNIGGGGDPNPLNNPAGLLYKITVNTCTPAAPAPATLHIDLPSVPASSSALISINGAPAVSTTTADTSLNSGDHYTVTAPAIDGYTSSLTGDCDDTVVAGQSYECGITYTVITPTVNALSISPASDISTTTSSTDLSVPVVFTIPTAVTTATTSENILATTSISCVPDSGSLFTVGTTTPVLCTATDSVGNVATSTFNVTVTAIPVFVNPLTITSNDNISTTTISTDPSVPVIFTIPTATTTATTSDDSIATTSVSCVPDSGSLFAVGTTTPVLCTATDSVGNVATSTFNITVTAITSTPAPTTISSGGGNSFYSSGGGSGGGNFYANSTFGASTTVPLVSGQLSCPFLTNYVIPGRTTNLPSDITKVQLFLNLYNNANLPVNGILTPATVAGIKAFQSKFLGDIMGPWGLKSPSGNVYITTLKEINAIVCGTSKTLSPEDAAVIAQFRAQFQERATQTNISTSSAPTTTIVATSTSTTPPATTDNNDLTGNVISSPAHGFFQSILNAIKSWF